MDDSGPGTALQATARRGCAALAALLVLGAGLLPGAPAQAQQFQAAKDLVGRLFFSAEERNVLEAVRQGIVDIRALPSNEGSDIATQAIAVPKVVFKPKVTKDGDLLTREDVLYYGGHIRAHGKGGAQLIVNGELLDEEQIEVMNQSFGLNFRVDRDDGAVMFAEDKLFKANLALTKSDVIDRSGAVTKPNTGTRFIVVKRDG